jgi:hypothetical protein
MQTRITTMLCGAAALLATAAAPALAATCGDVNNDGSVAINDVSVHLRVVSGLDAASGICGGAGYANCANLNGDGAGDTDISDTDLLLQRVSGVNPCPSDQCVARVVHPGGNLPNSITGNYVVNANATMQGITFVEPGAVLTIAPGVTIKGVVQTPPSVLIVKPGGRINAVGTAGSPITITSANAVGTRGPGDIGGLAILGRAPVNESGATLEGITPSPTTIYGGTNVNDFSGCVSYMRVQFSGRALSTDNELNLFVMAGVGRTTRIDHVQAHLGLDDCIEWFGGTVNTKYMVASACGDDGFDTQLGTRGGLQFGLITQRLQNVESGGSNGFENDNSEFGFNNGPPFNEPKYCNVTAIGINGQAGSPPATNQIGVLSRRGNAISLNNSIVKDFRQAGYQMRDGATTVHACVNSTTLNTTPPVGVIQSTLFNDNGPAGATPAANDGTCDGVAPDDATCTCTTLQHFALLTAQKNVLDTTDGSIASIGGGVFPPTNLVPAGGLAASHPRVNCTTVDSSFVNAPYIGAFQPGGADWTAGWTEYPLL